MNKDIDMISEAICGFQKQEKKIRNFAEKEPKSYYKKPYIRCRYVQIRSVNFEDPKEDIENHMECDPKATIVISRQVPASRLIWP